MEGFIQKNRAAHITKYREFNLSLDRSARNLFTHACPVLATKLLPCYLMLPGLSR
jgi:hypothetical protein